MLTLHIVSFCILGICFEIPELLLNCYCFYLGRDVKRHLPLLRRIMRIRYVLTHCIGPLSGLTAIMTGMVLVHEGGYSFDESWLFWGIVAATIGIYKGMLQHSAYIRILQSQIEKPVPDVPTITRMIYNPFDHVLIFLEAPTYAVNYYVMAVRPDWPNPLEGVIDGLETFLPAKVMVGFLILTLGVLLVIPLRAAMTRWGVERLTTP